MNRPSLGILSAPILATFLFGLGAPTAAQDGFSLHALVGGEVVTAPGAAPVAATVVIRDGILEAIGPPALVTVPAGARVLDVAGLTLYPGFLEAYWATDPPNDPTPPAGAHENPSVRPERRIGDAAVEKDALKGLREAGFTTALRVASKGVFRGQGALTELAEGAVIDPRGPQVLAFETSRRTYPASIMGAVALIRQTYLDAAWYRDAHATFARNPAQPRPPYSAALEALAPDLAGHPVYVVTEDALAAVRGTRLARELGLRAVVVGSGTEYQWLAMLRDAQPPQPFPLILPLNFPEIPEVGTEGDAPGVTLAQLRHWEQAPENPAAVIGTALPAAFTSHGLKKPADLFPAVVQAIDRGLSPEDALAALTTEPARILGLEDRAGTLAVGKAANLLLVEGDLWVDRPVIREVWIEGRRFPIQEAKEEDSLAPEDVTGVWQVAMGGGEPVILLLRQPDAAAPDLEGALVADGIDVPLTAVTLDGRRLTLEYDGEAVGHPGTVVLRVDVEGEHLEGEGEGPEGSFAVLGERQSPAPPAPPGSRTAAHGRKAP